MSIAAGAMGEKLAVDVIHNSFANTKGRISICISSHSHLSIRGAVKINMNIS